MENEEEKTNDVIPLTNETIHAKIQAFVERFNENGIKEYSMKARIIDNKISIENAFFTQPVFLIECYEDSIVPFLVLDCRRNLYRASVDLHTFDDLHELIVSCIPR